jgi:hypothetical protein
MIKDYIGWGLEGLDGTSVAKMNHVLKEGDRVRVKETGHVGTIQNLGQFNRVYVKLDSSHVVECDPRELEPADFPTAPNLKVLARESLKVQAEGVRARIEKGVGAGCCDPFGGPTPDELLLAKLESWLGEDTMQKSASGPLHKRAAFPLATPCASASPASLASAAPASSPNLAPAER